MRLNLRKFGQKCMTRLMTKGVRQVVEVESGEKMVVDRTTDNI
jgi:hypothetical protein